MDPTALTQMLDETLVLSINLPEAVERRAFMAHQLESLPVTSEILEAVRGIDLDPVMAYGLGYRPRAVGGVGDLTMNEVACVLSHRKALKRFIQTDKQWLVVLEDDAVLDEAFVDLLCAALRFDACFDLLKIENRTGDVSCVLHDISEGHVLHIPNRPGLGATGVVYTRQGAAKVLRSLEVFSVGYDTHLGRLWRQGVRMLQVSPPIVRERAEIESTIGHGKSDGRVGRRELSRRWDRIVSSIGRRLFHGWLCVVIRWRLSRPGKEHR